MPTSYPGTVKTFTTKTDLVHVVHASHMNEVQDEINAIETELGTLPKGDHADVKARLSTLEEWIAKPLVSGRLTLESGVPISLNDQLAKATLYYTPRINDDIGLYYGGVWKVFHTPEISISLAGKAANKNFDAFAYYTGSAVALELVEWTNDSTRATALLRFDGVYVKTGDSTRRYLGTIRTTGTIGQCEDSELRRFVWNYYQQVGRHLFRAVTGSHTYNVAVYRQYNADNTLIIEFVIGLDWSFQGQISTSISTTEGSVIRVVLCIDDVAAANGATYRKLGACGQSTPNLSILSSDSGEDDAAAGYHYLNPEEVASVAGTNTFAALYIRGMVNG